MNQFKWDQKVKAEREANKAKKAALVAKLTNAPKPVEPIQYIDWPNVKPKVAPNYTFDPCPECGAQITELTANYSPSYMSPWSYSSPYVINEPTTSISVGPCGHQMKSVDYQAYTDMNGNQCWHAKLTGFNAPNSAYAKFKTELQKALPNGWRATIRKETSMLALSVVLRCSHGHDVPQPRQVSMQLIETAISMEGVVNTLLGQWPQMCQTSHGYPLLSLEAVVIEEAPQYSPQFYGTYLSPAYSSPAYSADSISGHPTVAALCKIVPGLREAKGSCPECDRFQDAYVASIIIHMNDSHRCTRERIAEWIESLPIDLTVQTEKEAA